jgi:hypothetical protein
LSSAESECVTQHVNLLQTLSMMCEEVPFTFSKSPAGGASVNTCPYFSHHLFVFSSRTDCLQIQLHLDLKITTMSHIKIWTALLYSLKFVACLRNITSVSNSQVT